MLATEEPLKRRSKKKHLQMQHFQVTGEPEMNADVTDGFKKRINL